VNYRGSLGFGRAFLDALLGKIGIYDIEDVYNLTKQASENAQIDENRIGNQIGSH
jgi:dipeptidyl aminopeptidase/acylaminoacyl peptidase